jgi:hypothetical protein
MQHSRRHPGTVLRMDTRGLGAKPRVSERSEDPGGFPETRRIISYDQCSPSRGKRVAEKS